MAYLLNFSMPPSTPPATMMILRIANMAKPQSDRAAVHQEVSEELGRITEGIYAERSPSR